MDKWNDDWREELKKDYEEVWIRLADCRNIRKDIVFIAKMMYKYNPTKSKQDCLDRTLEWITDWNNQSNLYPDYDDEYNNMLKKI